MGNCCISAEKKDKKRHPLLRNEHECSQSTTSSGLEAISSTAVKSLEYRARLDAIRGPPLFFVDKLPDINGLVTAKPLNPANRHELIRANLKAGIKSDNIRLPKGYPRIAWQNVHIRDFNDHIRTFNKYVLREHCSKYGCSRMYERPGRFYTWRLDDNGQPSPTISKKLNAPEYISKVLAVNQTLLSRMAAMEQDDHEEVELQVHEDTCGVVIKLILQVYCHMLYWHHDAFVEMDALPHLNTCFKWFVFFVSEMKLLEAEDAVPLQNLIDRIFEIENSPESDDDFMADHNLSLARDDKSSLYSDDVSKLTIPSFDARDRQFSSDSSFEPGRVDRM